MRAPEPGATIALVRRVGSEAMEHRWGRRISVDLPVRVILSTGSVIWGRVRNLSITGAFVESAHLLPAGTRVSVEPMTGAGHWPARALPASVIWSRSSGAGLEWCEPWESAPWEACERGAHWLQNVGRENPTAIPR